MPRCPLRGARWGACCAGGAGPAETHAVVAEEVHAAVVDVAWVVGEVWRWFVAWLVALVAAVLVASAHVWLTVVVKARCRYVLLAYICTYANAKQG